MATTYTALKTNIAAWMGRQDLGSQLDTFISMFEAWANRNLRVRQMETEATTPATEYIELPSDYLELRDIQYQAANRVQLQYVTPEFADAYDSSGAAGTPLFYTLVGNQIRLVPAPDSSTDVRISYWQRIPAISVADTNWLATEYEDAYLYGSLIHARGYLTDPAMAQAIAAGWSAVMAEIQAAGQRSNVGGSLQVRPA